MPTSFIWTELCKGVVVTLINQTDGFMLSSKSSIYLQHHS